jgi:hypothetical protein
MVASVGGVSASLCLSLRHLESAGLCWPCERLPIPLCLLSCRFQIAASDDRWPYRRFQAIWRVGWCGPMECLQGSWPSPGASSALARQDPAHVVRLRRRWLSRPCRQGFAAQMRSRDLRNSSSPIGRARWPRNRAVILQNFRPAATANTIQGASIQRGLLAMGSSGGQVTGYGVGAVLDAGRRRGGSRLHPDHRSPVAWWPDLIAPECLRKL